MRTLRTGGIILLASILCLFVFTQVPLTSAVHLTAPSTLIVSVESPLTSKDYSPGEVVPVIVVISDRQGIPMTNASVLVTSSYDMQFVHVPFLKITQMNQTQVAVYGPSSSAPANQAQPTQVGLVLLNDAGFVQLPYSTGDWSLELQIEPLTGAYIPYHADITVHITTRPPIILYILAVGWLVTICFVAFVIRKRIRRLRLRFHRARACSLKLIPSCPSFRQMVPISSLFRVIGDDLT